MLVAGLRNLGIQFAEFSWVLDEVNDQLTVIVQGQAEIAAGARAMLEAQQQTLMQLAMLRQQTRPAPANAGHETTGMSPDGERAAALEAAGVPAVPDCPYPGLARFGPQDADRFFGREPVVAALVSRLAEQLTRPGLLTVLGPSGSGKSSLLRAGLLPAIAVGEFPRARVLDVAGGVDNSRAASVAGAGYPGRGGGWHPRRGAGRGPAC